MFRTFVRSPDSNPNATPTWIDEVLLDAERESIVSTRPIAYHLGRSVIMKAKEAVFKELALYGALLTGIRLENYENRHRVIEDHNRLGYTYE